MMLSMLLLVFHSILVCFAVSMHRHIPRQELGVAEWDCDAPLVRCAMSDRAQRSGDCSGCDIVWSSKQRRQDRVLVVTGVLLRSHTHHDHTGPVVLD